MAYNLKMEGADRLVEMFRKAPEITERWAQRAVNASVQEVLKHSTRDNLPWLTGRLTRSFGEGIEIGRLYGAIGPTVDYAMAVHEKSSKPNFMPRIMEASQSGVIGYFEEAVENIAKELAS